MNIVSIREVTPDVGKEKLWKSDLRRASGNMAKHGATTRHVFKVIVGQGVGDLSIDELM